MATNRQRRKRQSRNNIPVTITEEYLKELEFRDFMGELSEEEIPLAERLNVYKWDGWMKEKNARMKSTSQ